MINLIPRFHDVAARRILIDKMNVRQIERTSLLDKVGIMPQDTILSSMTVRDNIRHEYMEPGDEEVIAATKAATSPIPKIHARTYSFLFRSEERISPTLWGYHPHLGDPPPIWNP